MPEDDLVCPECGGPIGTTSAYCMHCSADLTDRHPTGSTPDESPSSDDVWLEADTGVVDVEDVRNDEPAAHPQDLPPAYRSNTSAVNRTKLLPDDFAIKALSLLLAIAAGLAVGIGSAVLLSRTLGGSVTYLLAVLAWFGSTAAFVRVAPG